MTQGDFMMAEGRPNEKLRKFAGPTNESVTELVSDGSGAFGTLSAWKATVP